ncbi:MAG: NUDIX domain-containing protein [Gemmatimonadota bacterium]
MERIERAEFERGHIGPDDVPVAPRPAATVVLARPAQREFEVLLLRRPANSRFAAGAFVFPGGAIDREDGAESLQEVLPALDHPEQRPALAAAIRELFEETGILPADRVPSLAVRSEARERLLRGEANLPRIVRELDLCFRRLEVIYMARWITPALLARRYDTRFFLMRHAGGEPVLSPEHTGHLWVSPRVGLARFRARELPMLLPTWKTLEMLDGYPDLDEAMRALAVSEVVPILARLAIQEGVVRPVMPDDPGYESAE